MTKNNLLTLIYKILQDPSGPFPSSLASFLNMVPSLPSVCKPVILELPYSMTISCFVFFPLSKISLPLSIFFPFLLMFTHLSGLSLDAASPESIPSLPPNLYSEWSTLPLFLRAPKAPCTYLPLNSYEFYCHLLAINLHKNINTETSENVPILFITKYQATSTVLRT